MAKTVFIRSGKPTQNAYIESINGRFRDECLNDHRSLTLHEARVLIGHGEKITIGHGLTVSLALSRQLICGPT